MLGVLSLAFGNRTPSRWVFDVGAVTPLDAQNARLVVGHSLTGVHASYLTRLVVENGPGLRAAQRCISRRIVELLGA